MSLPKPTTSEPVLSREGPNEKSSVKQKESFAYDAFGRLTSRKVTRDNGASYIVDVEVEKVTYFDAESPQRVRRESLIEFDETRWVTVDELFDGHGRLKTTTTILPGVDRIVSHEYDAAGNLIQTVVPDSSQNSASYVAYSTTHDQLGRPTGYLTPATSHPVFEVTYDGLSRHRKMFDANGLPSEESIVSNDEFGRLIKVEELTSSSTWATTAYEHDLNDNLTKVTSADGVVTDLGNNWLGWRSSITRGGRTWSYTYDKNGNTLTAIDPIPSGGVATNYTTSLIYDDLDRPTSKLPGSREMTPTEMDDLGIGLITYSYDAGDNGIGSLTSVDRGVVWSNTMAYSARGQLVDESKSFTVPGASGNISDSRTQSYEYNALGARNQTTFADDTIPARATMVTTEFDDAGRPTTLKKGGTTLASLERNVAGQITLRENTSSTSDPKRRWREFSYDTVGRVTSDKVLANVFSGFSYVPKARAHQTFVYDGGLYRVKELRNYVGNANTTALRNAACPLMTSTALRGATDGGGG